jgi:hypothetical protein
LASHSGTHGHAFEPFWVFFPGLALALVLALGAAMHHDPPAQIRDLNKYCIGKEGHDACWDARPMLL